MPRTFRSIQRLQLVTHDRLMRKDCRENKLKGSAGTSSQRPLKTRLRVKIFNPKEMLKDKQESFTIGWHVRKLFLAVLWRRKGVKQRSPVAVVQSRANGGLNRGLAVAPRGKQTRCCPHTCSRQTGAKGGGGSMGPVSGNWPKSKQAR